MGQFQKIPFCTDYLVILTDCSPKLLRMKKLMILFLAFLFLSNSFANISILTPPKKASELFIPIGTTGQKISLMELSQINQTDLQTFTGRKMGIMEKIAFKAAQKELKNNINPDGTFNKRFAKKLEKRSEGTTGFHAGGFFLGFLLGPIGVLIAYLIKDDKKRNRVKWAWIGWGAWVAIIIIIAASGGAVY